MTGNRGGHHASFCLEQKGVARLTLCCRERAGHQRARGSCREQKTQLNKLLCDALFFFFNSLNEQFMCFCVQSNFFFDLKSKSIKAVLSTQQ